MAENKEKKHVWVVERQEDDWWRPVHMEMRRGEAYAEAKWRRELLSSRAQYRVRKYIRDDSANQPR